MVECGVQYEDFAAEIHDLGSSMTPEEIFKPGNVIRFRQSIPFLPDNIHKIIWVHKDYPNIADDIEGQVSQENKVRSFHLVGTPGTGKSTFGVLWLIRLALRKQKILFRSKDKSWVLYDFTSEDGFTTRVFENYVKAGRFVDSSVWLIMDGASKPVLHPGPILQCVSDVRESYMDFSDGCGKLLFMEPWDWEDCEACLLEAQLDVDDLELRFFYSGGIPRYLYNQCVYTCGDLKSMIDNAAGCVEDWERISAICWNRGVSEKLFHYRYVRTLENPWTGHTTTRVCVPASDYAKNVTVKGLTEKSSHAMSSFIDRLRGTCSAAGLRQAAFERVVHEELSRGGCFTMKSLGSSDKGKPDEFQKSLLPLRAVCKYDDQKACLSYVYAELFTSRSQIHMKDKLPLQFLGWEHYVKPVMKTEGAWDSFLTPGKTASPLIFQVSVSLNSPIKWKYVRKLIEFLDEWCGKQGRAAPSKYWFVFVVPEDLFPSFTEQSVLGDATEQPKFIERVEQFVLLVKVSD